MQILHLKNNAREIDLIGVTESRDFPGGPSWKIHNLKM
jgi:hypothetical protein